MKRKKPTSREVQTVIEKLILEVASLDQITSGLTNLIMEYIDFKKDTKKFEKHLLKKEKVNAGKKSTRKNTNRK